MDKPHQPGEIKLSYRLPKLKPTLLSHLVGSNANLNKKQVMVGNFKRWNLLVALIQFLYRKITVPLSDPSLSPPKKKETEWS